MGRCLNKRFLNQILLKWEGFKDFENEEICKQNTSRTGRFLNEIFLNWERLEHFKILLNWENF